MRLLLASLIAMTITTVQAQMTTAQMIETYFETAAREEGMINAMGLYCGIVQPEFLRVDLQRLGQRYHRDQMVKNIKLAREVERTHKTTSCSASSLALVNGSIVMMDSAIKSLKQLLPIYEAEQREAEKR